MVRKMAGVALAAILAVLAAGLLEAQDAGAAGTRARATTGARRSHHRRATRRSAHHRTVRHGARSKRHAGRKTTHAKAVNPGAPTGTSTAR